MKTKRPIEVSARRWPPGTLVVSVDSNPDAAASLHGFTAAGTVAFTGWLHPGELGIIVGTYVTSPSWGTCCVVVAPSAVGWCQVHMVRSATGPVDGAPSGSRRGPPIKAP